LVRLETDPRQPLFLDRHLPDLDAEELTKRSASAFRRSKWDAGRG
jgi:hypothetical protein